MSYRVYISDHAARDLHAIYEHIAFHLQAPLNARKQLSRLEDAIYSLDIFPERHPRYRKCSDLAKISQTLSLKPTMSPPSSA